MNQPLKFFLLYRLKVVIKNNFHWKSHGGWQSLIHKDWHWRKLLLILGNKRGKVWHLLQYLGLNIWMVLDFNLSFHMIDMKNEKSNIYGYMRKITKNIDWYWSLCYLFLIDYKNPLTFLLFTFSSFNIITLSIFILLQLLK